MKTETFATGAQLFAQGDYSEEAYRILKGTVEISMNDGRSKVVLATLGEGEMFGEMGMVERLPRSATARAVTVLTVEVISEQDFNESLARGGSILVPYLTTIFERLRVSNERLREAHRQLDALQSPTPRGKVKVPPVQASTSQGRLLLEPDSEEARAQSAMQKQTLTSFPFVFGRRAEIAACVDLFSKTRMLIGDRMPYRVSRTHCAIEKEKGAYFVQDRGSKLGTIVNGVSIGGGAKEMRARLKVGANTVVLGPAKSAIRFIATVPKESD
jgi:CRP-like cAMP-binding protein